MHGGGVRLFVGAEIQAHLLHKVQSAAVETVRGVCLREADSPPYDAGNHRTFIRSRGGLYGTFFVVGEDIILPPWGR